MNSLGVGVRESIPWHKFTYQLRGIEDHPDLVVLIVLLNGGELCQNIIQCLSPTSIQTQSDVHAEVFLCGKERLYGLSASTRHE